MLLIFKTTRRFSQYGWQVANVSGNANNSSNAGTFYLNLNNSSGNTNQNIGSHACLSFSKCSHRCEHPAPWQNTKLASQSASKETERSEAKIST